VDQSINQTNTLEYNDAPNITTRYVFGYSEAAFLDSTTSSSALKRAHNASTYHHIKELIASKIIGYNLINEKLNPVDEISKQWKHWKIWNHRKPLHFYSVDTGNPNNPAEEWGEKVKMTVSSNNFNISPNTHLFEAIISSLERYIHVDAFQVFDHQNTTGIGEDTIILAIIIRTQFHHTILFVVTNAITQQPTVCFTPKLRRSKDLLL
jgi:hypothetical protein